MGNLCFGNAVFYIAVYGQYKPYISCICNMECSNQLYLLLTCLFPYLGPCGLKVSLPVGPVVKLVCPHCIRKSLRILPSLRGKQHYDWEGVSIAVFTPNEWHLSVRVLFWLSEQSLYLIMHSLLVDNLYDLKLSGNSQEFCWYRLN